MTFDPDGRWVPWAFGILLGLVGIAVIIMMAGALMAGWREHKALEALSPAERAVERHVMPDGTVCYQPRTGWSRPLSCVRGAGK